MPPHEGFDAILADYRERAREAMNRKVATLSEPLEALHDRESPLPTLLAEAIRRLTGSEIGVVNAGQLMEGLPAGK